MAEEGDIRVYNPSKEIASEIILEVLIRHRDAMKQARTGELPIVLEKQIQINDNERKFNQVRALNLIISAQKEMITLSRPVISYRSHQKWRKSHKSEEDQYKHPFKDHKNDYNDLKQLLALLGACEKDIIHAERTKTLDDDYIREKQDHEANVIQQLTENFFEMLEELENSYEQIYLLMLTNKIVSAGIEEDEELTYKQKEEEAIKRVLDA